MQREYEAVIGRLITNPTAMVMFMNQPDLFLADYELTEVERGNILTMKGQLPALSASFVGKRRRIIARPVRRTIELLGDYGEKLLTRYVTIYPPCGDYVIEHNQIVAFLREALSSCEEVEHVDLIQNVLILETSMFNSLRSIVPGEEIEFVNEDEPSFNVEVTPDTVVTVRVGVHYHHFQFNLSDIPDLEPEDLVLLQPEDTVLIIYRKFGDSTNTLMRVGATVLAALEVFSKPTKVSVASQILAEKGAVSVDSVLPNLIGLVQQFCAMQILAEVKNE